MKVFISWSGNRSKDVAILLSDWIKCVIQATRPWISTRDIDRGALWFTEIGDQLRDTSVGIVCLTQENKNKPWILFETGALAKGLSSNRVCTFLVDLKPEDLVDPLAQFNHTMPNKDSMWELVRTLNNSLADKGLDERVLEQVFSTYWGEFEKKFKELLKSLPPSEEKTESRTEKNLLAEILDNTRFLSNKIRILESKVENNSVDDITKEGFRRNHQISASSRKRMINDMLNSGLSPELVMKELVNYGYSPENVSRRVREVIIERNDTNQNEIKIR